MKRAFVIFLFSGAFFRPKEIVRLTRETFAQSKKIKELETAHEELQKNGKKPQLDLDALVQAEALAAVIWVVDQLSDKYNL